MPIPTDIANLLGWYSAAALSPGALASWTDLSGNGWHATQATSGQRPTVTASASPLGNLPAVAFEASNQTFLEVAPGVSSLAWTFAAVARLTGSDFGQWETVGGVHNGSSNPRILELNSGGANKRFAYHDGTPLTREATLSATRGTWYRLMVTVSSSAVKFYVNGTLTDTASGTAYTSAMNRLVLGYDQSGALFSGGYLRGQIADFAVWTRVLTGTELVNVDQYFVDQWYTSPPNVVAGAHPPRARATIIG
jgi:hypothetical protein